MKLLFDLHTHTTASGHAYSTLKENIEEAYAGGLLAYGFSDHAEAIPGSVKNIYFTNFKVIPKEYRGMRIYGGVEANIMDFTGRLDIGETVCNKVDYIIASLHLACIQPGSMEENTAAIIGAVENPYVKIIGHPDDSRYPIDYDAVVRAAVKNKTALELNNSSLKPGAPRTNGEENARILLNTCKKYGAYIICNTDSHICCDIGRFEEAERLLEETGFPEELVLNTAMEGLEYVLLR